MGKVSKSRIPLLLLLLAFCFFCFNRVAADNPNFACDLVTNPGLSAFGFCNTSWTVDARARDLVQRLTLEEKIGFLGHVTAAVVRLGIPSYNWWSEALHGVSFVGGGSRFSDLVPGATSFPQVILTAASFNVSLFRTIGKTVSTEARAMHNVGQAGLSFWSPNINVFRDPRWGRGQETPGEDPLLGGKYAVGFVQGLQDNVDDPVRLKVAACCKHYTAYDIDNWKGVQRYTFNAVVTEQDMADTFQPPFKSCVSNGVACAMCSYNQVNGVPSCADGGLLAGVIRGDWKLNGYIVSDCDSVSVIYNNQKYTKTPEDAAAITIKAGLDLDCGSFLPSHTLAAVQGGKVTEAQVDNAITNSFVVLMRLGFFDGDPRNLAPYGKLGPQDVCTPENQELARDAARQGIVLLKNFDDALPLNASAIKSVAVIGPNANATRTMIGNYEGVPCNYTSPLQGLSAVVTTLYEPGCATIKCSPDDLHLDGAKIAAARADATVIVVGGDLSIEAEGLDRENLLYPGEQGTLISEVAKVAKGPVILVIMSGGPFQIKQDKVNVNISSILWAGYPGEAGGAALADIIFGRYNPSGRTPFTWYDQEYVEQVPMTDMRMRPDPASNYPGRTYRFYTGNPTYAFGYGLSYTRFDHNLVQAPEKLSITLEEGHPCYSEGCNSLDLAGSAHCSGLQFDVHLKVQNSGGMAGSHTVLLFNTPPAVHNAPRKQLVGFEKVFLEPNESKNVAFQVDACRDLSVADESGNWKVPLGSHVLHVGDVTHTLTLSI
ncbi:unnamed protein product [Musa hybrid cultivar]